MLHYDWLHILSPMFPDHSAAMSRPSFYLVEGKMVKQRLPPSYVEAAGNRMSLLWVQLPSLVSFSINLFIGI